MAGLPAQQRLCSTHPCRARRALADRAPDIHHSDQGVQYACGDDTDLLREQGAQTSTAAVGKPEDNGYAEGLMGGTTVFRIFPALSRNAKEAQLNTQNFWRISGCIHWPEQAKFSGNIRLLA